MGPQEDYIETVFTCEGDINDPNLQSRLEDFQSQLKELLSTDKRKLILKKVEPWNSVRVTFNIPREAAIRLKQLAQQGNVTLRQLGVLAVQIEGDQLISLTIAGRNNARTQLIFRTADDTVDAPNLSLIDSGGGNLFGSPGPTNVQSTRKNIADYLRQGVSIFDNILLPDDESGPSVSSAAGVRPQNLVGQTTNLNSDKQFPHSSSHTISSSSSKSQGHELSHFHPEFDKNSLGAGKPPPPPYPEGSAWFNNVAKGIRGLPPTTSPLLVNLLQNDPTLALAGMNNFINTRMLPPTSDTSPPMKKKRKPRKPKTGSEGEATIQSVPNPVLSPYSMPTSGSSSNTCILPVPMVTQALAANTQPSVTFSKPLPSAGDRMITMSAEESNAKHVLDIKNYAVSSESTVNSIEPQQTVQESTVGKIINPYTGHLEPMEHSDLNPAKNCIPYERLSPQGLKNPGTEQTLLSKDKYNHVLSHNKLPSNPIKSVSTSPGNISLQHCHSETNTSQSVGSQVQGSKSLSVALSRTSSLALSTSQNHDLMQSSPKGNNSHRSNVFFNKKSHHLSTVSSESFSGVSSKELYKSSVMRDLHNVVKDSVTGGIQTITADTTYSSHKHLSNKDHEKMINSENLLNPLKNPAKTVGSCSDRSHGVDSDPNHLRSIHDTHMQNDIGAVSMGCTMETNSKVYFNDSGVGSSSERSDDTPSDAGDSDFKTTNNHVEEFSKSVCQENMVQKQNLLNKPDQHFITVGYAMSNQQRSEKYNDISNTLDKALNHTTLKKRNSDVTKLNNDLTDHQVAMMHLFNRNKKKSPKHFVNEDSLNKEHLQLLQKVESMQFLKESFHPNAKQEKSNQLGPSSRLMVPGRIENQHSPTSVYSNARTPSPRLINHDGKETSEINMCNKVRHSTGNTPVSEVEALHNDILSSYLNQTQKNQEKKVKSPMSSNFNDLISMENVSVNNSLGKHGDGVNAQGILKNDILNNIKRQENSLSISENESAKLSTSKPGSYKRRSSASANVNQLPQQFYDPKKLTESIQKLVKPLLPAESASLPHSQRRSPGLVGSKSCSSPQSQKNDGVKEPDIYENMINGPHDLDSVSSNDNSVKTNDVLATSSKDLLKLENDLEVKKNNSSSFNHVLTDKNKVNGSENGMTSDIKSAESGNHSLNCHDSASSRSAVLNISHQSDTSVEDHNFKYSEHKESIKVLASTSENKFHENHKQYSSENVKVQIGVSSSTLETISASKNDASKVPTSTGNVNLSETINSESDKILDKSLKNKNLNKRQEILCNTGVDYSLKVNCDSEKTSPKSSQKSPNLSPTKKSKSEENRPIKLHLSHGVITNPQSFSKEDLTNETITVITRTDRKTENSAGEPTVPPLVLKVSRKPAVLEPSVEQKHDESQALTMSLRARKASDASESTHNLRPPKPARQKSVEQDLEQFKIEESSKNLRQSRRRKTAPSENDLNPDSEKKAHVENCLQDLDQKAEKSEDTSTDIGENLTLFDNVKSGLRARTQNKPDEKVKVSPKDPKQNKAVEDDTSLKRNSQSRKSRQSPTATDKLQTKEVREKSPGRLSRTRSGQISPNAEDDSSKRSTRSAKPRPQVIETLNDATDTLPPANKRRRTTSRDHR